MSQYHHPIPISMDPAGGETSSTDRFNLVANRIAERNDRRLKEEDIRRRQRLATTAHGENSNVFLDKFAEHKEAIMNQLTEAETLEGAATADLLQFLDVVTVKMEQLQKYMTESAIFLTSFDIEQSKTEFQDLTKRFNETRDRLLPKKKFAFGARSAAKKPAPSASIIAPIPPPAQRSIFPNSSNVRGSFTIAGKHGCGILQESGPALAGSDMYLTSLSDCEVRLLGHPAAVTAAQLTHCTVLCGPVSGAIFVEDCNECTFVLACQQLRIHSTTRSTFSIHVTSKAIVEFCMDVRFAPYCLSYPGLSEDFIQSGLSRDVNNWDKVDDFCHLARDVPSANWSILPASERTEFRLE